MYAPSPSSIQVEEYRRQERLAHAEAMRMVAEVHRSRDAATAETTRPRPAFGLTYARSLVASLASIAVAMTAK